MLLRKCMLTRNFCTAVSAKYDVQPVNASGAPASPIRSATHIYRSDKLQNLPPPPLGQPKSTQAEVSKIIAAQWRAESEDVRAETAKVEHARMYPDYCFAPVKKADKDRFREEKRQAKEQERAGRRVRARIASHPLPFTASSYQTSSSLIIKHVVPNVNPASPSIPSSSSSSSPSLSSMILNSQPDGNVAPYDASTRVYPTRLPTRNSNSSTHKIHLSTN